MVKLQRKLVRMSKGAAMNKRKTLVFLCLLFVLISAIILYGVISMKKKNDSAERLAEQLLSGKKNAITLVRESGISAKGVSKIGGIPMSRSGMILVEGTSTSFVFGLSGLFISRHSPFAL